MICRNGHDYEIPDKRRGCPVCATATRERWKDANREKERARKLAHYRALRDSGEWLIRRRRYYAENPGKRQAGYTNSILAQRTPPWADRKAMEVIYGLAALRTAQTGIPHEVDHVIPLRGRTVSGLHVETNLQVLPREINRVKSNHFT